MDNGDATQGHAMTPEEFAKLMGAYPQPAENPLPTYGGYMDNSPANFSFVEFNDSFGAETFGEIKDGKIVLWNRIGDGDWHGDYENESYADENGNIIEVRWYFDLSQFRDNKVGDNPMWDGGLLYDFNFSPTKPEGYVYWVNEKTNEILAKAPFTHMEILTTGRKAAETFSSEYKHCDACEEVRSIDEFSLSNDPEQTLTEGEVCDYCFGGFYDAETFEAPYAGAGSLFGIKQDTGLEGFTTSELTTSSAIHGDFDEASLNYSGHQNFEVRAEGEMNAEYYDGHDETDNAIYTSGRNVSGNFTYVQHTHIKKYKDSPYEDYREHHNECQFEMPIEEFLKRNKKYITIERDIYDAKDAEMEMIDDSNARIRNRFGDEIGMVAVDDHDVEDAVVEVSDGSDMIQEVIISEAETKKSSMIPLALGAVAAIIAFPKVTEFFNKKEEKAADTPELIENPNTGNLDPAQYEEMVVESTGYAVDVIPQVLDGSFMGSRFAALPTERYVEYNEPGIGAHTDIALNRDEIYLEPEMAMVQASENVVKESQAPGQSPYNSTTGEENPDFDMRVLKETQVISLDPAVKPFIPQSMSGYTGNANTPPSVLNKMFNTGVLGQTPAFVPGSGDIGASHTGSRNATPNTLGLGGSVGGPLSDQVNASYTDGTTSMSLAQWAIENTVSQTSDTEAVVIDRSSGLMKRVRRV